MSLKHTTLGPHAALEDAIYGLQRLTSTRVRTDCREPFLTKCIISNRWVALTGNTQYMTIFALKTICQVANWITGRLLSLHYSVFTGCLWRHELSSKSPPWCTPFIINAGQHISSNTVQFNTAKPGRRQLRSSTDNAAFVVRTRTQFGKRAFSVCGPSICNQIPPQTETILLRLFAKLLRLICFCNYRHCNALSVFIDVDRALWHSWLRLWLVKVIKLWNLATYICGPRGTYTNKDKMVDRHRTEQ